MKLLHWQSVLVRAIIKRSSSHLFSKAQPLAKAWMGRKIMRVFWEIQKSREEGWDVWGRDWDSWKRRGQLPLWAEVLREPAARSTHGKDLCCLGNASTSLALVKFGVFSWVWHWMYSCKKMLPFHKYFPLSVWTIDGNCTFMCSYNTLLDVASVILVPIPYSRRGFGQLNNSSKEKKTYFKLFLCSICFF